ncbi:uncharacterized protein [Malus domestica]|uniref:uncharacterized protein n=1 Tax=Malus domestica TaxID=3750 RepID=UPI003974A9F8
MAEQDQEIVLVQAFYEGLNDSNKAIVDSACNGMLMKMSDEETIEMCEELVENSQQFNTKGRQAKRGAYAVNANDGMQVEMAAMNRNIAALIKTLSPQSSQQALKFDGHPNFSYANQRNVLNPSQGNTQLQGIAPGFSELKKTSLEDSIAKLEIQVGQLASAVNERQKREFPSQPIANPKGAYEISSSYPSHEQVKSITILKSGTQVDNKVQMANGDRETNLKKNEAGASYKDKPPFPQALIRPKKDNHFSEIMELFKKVHINIPLLEAIRQIPSVVYVELGLGELKRSPITLEFADGSVKKSCGASEDMLMQIDKFYYLMDLIVLDTRPMRYSSTEILIILGCPFLATAKANIQCDTGVLTLCFGDMKAKFDLYPAHGLQSGVDHVESIHPVVRAYKNN